MSLSTHRPAHRINQSTRHTGPFCCAPLLLVLVAAATLPSGCQTDQQSTGSTGGQAADNETLRFRVTLDEAVQPEPFTGRFMIFFSESGDPEPRFGSPLSDLEPVVSVDVENLEPGDPVVLDAGELSRPRARSFPEPMDHWDPQDWHLQVLADRGDRIRRDAARQPGNLYSEVSEHSVDPDAGHTIELVADRQVEEPETPPDTEWVQKVEIRSEKLSEFHGRDTYMRAGVILPPGYHDEERTYPAVYVAPGFGGRHTGAWNWINGHYGQLWRDGEFPMPMLRIVLDPDDRYGNSVFANSANKGPVGDALVQELIPAIEERFRIDARPDARFVKGHSSGGWASLWLQITYPEYFGGTWSTGPDPVDFRYFQLVNIYEHDNAYWDSHGRARPSMRVGDEIVLSIREENRYEYVTGPGGQWLSWFAVFGPRGEDGEPQRLWDPLTGQIDRQVARQWRDYDIRLQLEQNWPELQPHLQDKLHIIGGAEDNFYLELALRELKDFLDEQDHGGYVEIHPGDHGSFRTPELMMRIYEEMARNYEQGAQ